MKLKFRLTVPGTPGGAAAETACELTAGQWSERTAELEARAADNAPGDFPRELAAHLSRIERSLLDDFFSSL